MGLRGCLSFRAAVADDGVRCLVALSFLSNPGTARSLQAAIFDDSNRMRAIGLGEGHLRCLVLRSLERDFDRVSFREVS